MNKGALNWPVETETLHCEFTVTERCYLIDALTPCSGCTLVSVQSPEPSIITNNKVPLYAANRYKIDVDFVTGIAQREIDERGINLITYMGGEPLTIRGFEKVIRWTADHPVLTGLIYSSSAYYLNQSGKPNRKFLEHEAAGLFSNNFGYFKASVDWLILHKSDIPAKDQPLHGESFKSHHGLKLAETIKNRGYQPAIHQTIRKNNISNIIPLYEWAKERGIKYSLCAMVYKPYLSRGESEDFYSDHLTSEHRTSLQEIINYLITDTIDRFEKGLRRLFIPSSAFTRLLPKAGAQNSISCWNHRKGIQPNTYDIHPNGQRRWCIAQNTAEDGQKCNGCAYIGIDRGASDWYHFEELEQALQPDDVRWLNADVWIKDPAYDKSGQSLFHAQKERTSGFAK